MKMDVLQQYARLKQQLTEEKASLEARLNEINEVLGSETAFVTPTTTRAQFEIVTPTAKPRRGRRTAGNTMSMREAVMKALSRGPIARKDLVQAVEAVGYEFTTKNPLNSIGFVLYAKNTPIKNKDGKFYVEGGQVGMGTNNGNELEAEPLTAVKKKRKISRAGRARMSEAAKARWAKQKAGK